MFTLVTVSGAAMANAPDYSDIAYADVVNMKGNFVFAGTEYEEIGYIGLSGMTKPDFRCLVGLGYAVLIEDDMPRRDMPGGFLFRDLAYEKSPAYKKLSTDQRKRLCPETNSKQNIYINVPSRDMRFWRMVK